MGFIILNAIKRGTEQKVKREKQLKSKKEGDHLTPNPNIRSVQKQQD